MRSEERRGGRAFWLLLTTAIRSAPGESLLTLVLTLAQGARMLTPLWLKLLTDGVLHRDAGRAFLAAALIALSYLLFMAVLSESMRLRLQLGERIGFEMDKRLTELSARLPGLEHHERPEFLDRLQLLRQNESGLRHLVNQTINWLSVMAQFAVTLVLLASVHPLLLLLPLAGLPSVLSASWAQGRMRRAEEDSGEDLRRAQHLFGLATAASPAKEIRVFNVESEVVRRHDESHRAAWDRTVRVTWITSLVDTAAYVIRTAAMLGAIRFVVLRALHGLASPGDVVLAVTLSLQTGQTLGSVVSMINWLLRTLRNAERLLWLVDYAAEQEHHAAGERPTPDRIESAIELDRVSFRYPGTNRLVLDDVSLHVPAGACVAIVGDNGAGKTTLVKLLSRFYEPTTGAIRIDGTALPSFSHESWRERMSAGFQDFARLELIARETVGVGDLPRIDQDDTIHAALQRAGGTDVLDALPGGLQTQLGTQWEGGTDLSSGQWQKLALGRAMMRTQPLMLILDEPTASLDAETEHALFERYSDAARRATAANGGVTVLVSHRFSTVRMADLIIVIDGGRIVEHGTHNQLVAQAGLYAELYDLQAKAYR